MKDINAVLLDLLPLLYQCPGDPVRWSVFVEQLTKATGAVQGLFLHHDSRNRRTDLASGFNLDLAWVAAYQDYFQFKNPYLKLPLSRILRVGSFSLLDELIPDKEVEKTEFFHDYVSPQGLTVRNAIRLTPFHAGEYHTSIALHRSASNPGDRPEQALAFCQALMPHLRAALALHQRIAGLEVRLSTFAGALDQIRIGVIMLDTAGNTLFVNDIANAIIARNDGLQLKNNKLTAASANQNRLLSRSIQDCIQLVLGRDQTPGSVLRISRPSKKRPFELVVTPAFEQEESIIGHTKGVVLFLSDPESRTKNPGQLLRRLYGLTAAEERVTLLLVQGYGAAEIADKLGVSRETVKSHLKHIFDKTDAHRQSELVSRILKGPAFFAAN